MKVWIVAVSDCESTSVGAICSTKEIAIREMFNERDRLVKEWKEAKIYHEESTKKFIEESAAKGIHFGFDTGRDMYGDMIKALSSDDWENWDNYPQERPYIFEREIIEQ